ncbi:hypothetical protein HanPSC8_Chr05g0225141 [Helianthus annuus]|nr:hypothetical protein HanPSC8_Chr05g0225141 [Helianthus annuus]
MKSFQETPMNNDEEPEESSWTFYFEEFLWQNDHKVIMSCDETLNSLVPDATSSSIVKNAANCFQDGHNKNLRLKKRKNKETLIDDSLEDTASSPLSCPKVTYFDQVKIDKTKTLHISEEKVGTCEGQNKRRVSSNMELKKRGLCLAPLSSLANYLS